MTRIIDTIEANRRLLTVVLDYLLYLSKSDADPDQRVRRRTIRLRHILATTVIDGIKAGELAAVDVRDADNLLYGLIESAVFRLVVLKQESAAEIRQCAIMAIHRLEAPRKTAARAKTPAAAHH